jgi:hypothetical protein
MIRVLLVLLGTAVLLRGADAAEVRRSDTQISFTVERPVQAFPALDAKRLFALGMIETGNDDSEVGAAGEVSRYQIHPTVWKAYSETANYQDTEVATAVARRHWAWLAGYFVEKTGRQPSDFDMYVMWNTGLGYYSRKGFLPAQLAGSVRERAQRFVNLVNRKS